MNTSWKVWVVSCYDPKRGRYPRFSSLNASTADFWFSWLKNNEPETLPEKRLCELTPVEG